MSFWRMSWWMDKSKEQTGDAPGPQDAPPGQSRTKKCPVLDERGRVFADFPCVTRWSRLSNVWNKEIMARGGTHGCDRGFTTSIPLADFLVDDALIALRRDGEPLRTEQRYGW